MRIALVSMPWPLFDAPSTSLGSLCALLRRDRPSHPVSCKYAYVYLWQMLGPIYERLSASSSADFIFVPQIYPEQTEAVRTRFDDTLLSESPGRAGVETSEELATHFQRTQQACATLLDRTVTQLSGQADLVGFSITYSQLFASLAAAQRIKAEDPNCAVVFGGSGVDGECGRSVLAQFDCVDYVIQGEGERPLLHLVDALESGQPPDGWPGLLTLDSVRRGDKGESFTNEQRLNNQIADLDTLPLPDYGDYAELADELSIYWHLPLEGSRGCWWNRTLTTGNPLKACHFCSLNSSSYREKSVRRVTDEIGTQVMRYKNTRLRFMDNVVRRQGLPDLLDAMNELDIDLRFMAEVRASLSPYELLLLKEAGCHHVQIGVEGLSTSYLRRIGKGTTTIQNLQSLKTCADLELQSASNLLVGFPGATEQEVQETVTNILDYAIAYEPMNVSKYRLGYGSSVQEIPDHFGVTNLRNAEMWAATLPNEVAGTLQLTRLDYDCESPVDWTPVVDAVETWKQFRCELPRNTTHTDRPLFYTDGKTFLEIVDRRGDFRAIELEGIWREIYLYCLQIRKYANIVEHFRPHPEFAQLEEVLDGFIGEKLMFSERGQYLSLALAANITMAKKRLLQRSPQSGHCLE